MEMWHQLDLLESTLMENIRIFYVFGEKGTEALLVTHDNLVYGMGTNKYGCLGLGHDKPTPMPKIVAELSGMGIINFAFGDDHVLSLNKCGQVFSWGYNGSGQLGNGNTDDNYTPKQISFKNERIIQIACGNWHSMALTTDGSVYGWGYNCFGQIGIGSTTDQKIPIKINIGNGAYKAESIACGFEFSMVIVEPGIVYGWGWNKNRQIGLGNTITQLTPVLVPGLYGIKAIICGSHHTLALSGEGLLFIWGLNDCGQVGNGRNDDQKTPQKIWSNADKVIKIGASIFSCISVIQTEEGKLYMWGMCGGEKVKTPKLTKCSSVDEVFATFSDPAISPSCCRFALKITASP
jgi:alpha-tubulin suppressor-like RCC1 family protein